jgi:hypothetical protein
MDEHDRDFGGALALLKDGYRVTRSGWDGKGMWLTLSPGCPELRPDRIWSEQIQDYANAHGGTAQFRPYIMMLTAQGDFVPWVASQTDLLAEDWQVL